MFDMQVLTILILILNTIFMGLLFAHASCVHDLLVFKEMIFVCTPCDKIYLR